MRITPELIDTIVKTIRNVALPDVKVGGLKFEARHGGNLDFLIEAVPASALIHRARIKLLLEQA